MQKKTKIDTFLWSISGFYRPKLFGGARMGARMYSISLAFFVDARCALCAPFVQYTILNTAPQAFLCRGAYERRGGGSVACFGVNIFNVLVACGFCIAGCRLPNRRAGQYAIRQCSLAAAWCRLCLVYRVFALLQWIHA